MGVGTRSDQDIAPMRSLPFPELEAARPPGIDSETSRYTAPTWVRATPRRRSARVQRPRPAARTSVDLAYAQLLSEIRVDETVLKVVQRWGHLARNRLLEAVRCHLGDVDGFICGSLASTAQAATTPWDVDLCLRAYSSRPEWEDDAHAPTRDLGRWIRATVGGAARVHERRGHVEIESPGGLTVDVTLAWRSLQAPGSLVRCVTSGHGSELVPFDPAAHHYNIVARNDLLGHDGAFLDVLRVAKHLSARWEQLRDETAPLTSFELEVLALAICTEPFEVAEGLPYFFRCASELASSSVPCTLAPAGELKMSAPEAAVAMLSDAADRCEKAMFATDVPSAIAELGDAFAW